LLLPLAETNSVVIEINEVPPVVRETAIRAAGNVELINAAREMSRDGMVYELSGCTAEGAKVEVSVYGDGTLQEVQHEIEVRDVPWKMLDVARANIPDFHPTLVVASRREGTVLSYDMEGEANGRRYSVEVWTNRANINIEPWLGNNSPDSEPRCEVGA
jgi:hypothetical protein